MDTKLIAIGTGHRIDLTPEFIGDITSSVVHTISLFGRELAFFYKQAVLGHTHYAFELLCYLDRKFVGFSYFEVYRHELRLMGNDSAKYPGTFQWYVHDRSFDFSSIKEHNERGIYALFIDHAYQRGNKSSQLSGFGTLLIKTSLLIAEKKYPWIRTLRITPLGHAIPFYEHMLNEYTPYTVHTPWQSGPSFPFKKIMQRMDRTVRIKKHQG